jgi:integrase
VAREVSPPRFERREFTPLSSAEARVLLAAAADDRLYGVYVLALVLGMRRGEVLGLRWSAVDLDGGTLRVRSSLQRVGGQLVLSSPKTRRSRRVIPLPRAVVKVLRAHRESQAVERATAEVWGDHDLVFTTTIADQHHVGHLHARDAGAVPGGGRHPRRLARDDAQDDGDGQADAL